MKGKKRSVSDNKESMGLFENFKVLISNLIPLTPEQAEWICSEIERLSREYPNLIAKLEEHYRRKPSEAGLNGRVLLRILDEIERKRRKKRRKGKRGEGRKKADD